MPPISNDVREPRRFSGAELARLRVDAGLSRTELAARIGRGTDTIRHYETGRHVPPGDVLGDLSHVLGVHVDAFYADRPQAVTS